MLLAGLAPLSTSPGVLQSASCLLRTSQSCGHTQLEREVVSWMQTLLHCTSVNPYKTVKRGEPPLRKQPTDNRPPPDTAAPRTRGVIHTLARAQDDRTRPKPEEQTVPGFSGFHARMSNGEEKSRPIYHMTYPNPPSKTILNDVMCKLAKSMEEKNAV